MFKNIGIIGAGQMGQGIAQSCMMSGYNVIMNDISLDNLNKAAQKIEANLSKLVTKEKLSDSQKSDMMARLILSVDIKSFASCDLVIEAATEKEEIKIAIFKNLCTVISPNCFIATNTSSLSVTKLASTTDRPDKFMGVHFMNPVPVMKLVELIRGLSTSGDTFQKMNDFVISLDKIIAVSHDFPAFIVNRILIPMINEAIYTLYEGIADIQSIDNALKLGANFPMGPLELADFIGLDTCLSIMQRLHSGMGDTKYRPCPLLIQYVEAGWLGKKTNKGFYNYT